MIREKLNPDKEEEEPKEDELADDDSTTAPQRFNVGKSNTTVHTASRVLNPPGGRSSITIG